MKRLFLLLLLALPFMAHADGWRYEGYRAMILSDAEYLDGDFDNPNYLGIIVDGAHDKDLVAIGIEGDGLTDFRDKQLYVVVKFDWGKDERWRIIDVKEGKGQFKLFFIQSADKFINRLRSCDSFQVTLPIFRHGTQTFYFSANGYPLDW